MKNKTDNTQRQKFLLSLSVFKKLYDEKRDFCEIIACFIKCKLSDSAIREFSLTEITQKINREYCFDIPQAMVETSLKRLQESGSLKLLAYDKYTKIGEFQDINIINKDSNTAKEEEEYIVKIFQDSIKERTLSDDEIKKSLEFYILNKNDEYDIFPHINACIVTNESNTKFVDGLNEIKHGLILYEGIAYGVESINLNQWNQKTIFLDTEILFYLGGYDGDLFKKMATDFMLLITIMNKDKDKKIVTLTFSEDIKKEIDSFFNVAESIIEEKVAYRPNAVINSILSKCKNPSDIVSERADFYSFLSKHGITEYKYKAYYRKENHQYNLEHESDADEKTQKHIKQLSAINILRQGNVCTTLNEVEYLLLTETRNTIDLSTEYKKIDNFSLALSLFDLTSQLWIQTNKGLGNPELPATFDIRNKAKIALSSSSAKKICEEFDKLSSQYENKSIDENLFIDKISNLKKISSNPDNINKSNSEEIKNIITIPDFIERHYEETSFYKEESESKSNIIKERERDLQEKDCELQKKDRELQEKDCELQKGNNKINQLEKEEEKRKFRNKKILKGLIFLFIAFLLFYFSAYLMQFIGRFIYIIEGVASIMCVCSFFGVDWSKIKLWSKKH